MHAVELLNVIYVCCLQINFDRTYQIISLLIKHRTTGANPKGEQNKDLELEFSDGYKVEVIRIKQTSMVSKNIKMGGNSEQKADLQKVIKFLSEEEHQYCHCF